MTKEEYFQMVEEELESLKTLMKKKNNDYTGGDKISGPFDNFKLSEQLGICSAEQGLLLRMLDKIQRLKTFILKGTLAVENEGYKDAILDCIGYSLLLLGLLKERQEEKENSNGLPH